MEWLNPEAIGLIGAAAVTSTFGFISTIMAMKNRNETKGVRDVAQKAVDNTTNVSNGFVGRMDRKLDVITNIQYEMAESQAELQKAFREHLEWHLDKEASQ